eukprot:scaffold7451_cov820-Prasinococcus_capsulatus_cf.AAC.1
MHMRRGATAGRARVSYAAHGSYQGHFNGYAQKAYPAMHQSVVVRLRTKRVVATFTSMCSGIALIDMHMQRGATASQIRASYVAHGSCQGHVLPVEEQLRAMKGFGE